MHRPDIKAVKHGQIITDFANIPIWHSESKLVIAEIAENSEYILNLISLTTTDRA